MYKRDVVAYSDDLATTESFPVGLRPSRVFHSMACAAIKLTRKFTQKNLNLHPV